MKTAHIALLSAIGLSTVAIAQTTTPQTAPENGTDNLTTAPVPGNTEEAPTAPTPTVPESDSTTTTTPDSGTTSPEATTANPGAETPPQR